MCPEFEYLSNFDDVYESDDEYNFEEDPFFNIDADVLDAAIRNSDDVYESNNEYNSENESICD